MKDSIFYSKIMNQIIFNKLKINKNLDWFVTIHNHHKKMKRVESKQENWRKGLNIKVQKDVQQKI
jgi:hypothetical protein